MDKQRFLGIIKQQKQVAIKSNELGELLIEGLKEWGDKQVNVRLERALQAKFDEVYGVEKVDYGSGERSRVSIYYRKEKDWSGNSKIKLYAFTRELVERLPEIEVKGFSGSSMQGDQYNENEVEAGDKYGSDTLTEIIDKTEKQMGHNLETIKGCDKAIAEIDTILERYREVNSVLEAYKNFTNRFEGSIGYTIRQHYKPDARLI